MSDDADDPDAAWREAHDRRVAAVSAPYGLLALTGTRRLADYPEGRIPAVPGHWRAAEAGAVLTATPEDSRRLDGEPLTGELLLDADEAPPEPARLSAGERRIVVIRRKGGVERGAWPRGGVGRPPRPRLRTAGAVPAVRRGPERPGGERRRAGARARPRRRRRPDDGALRAVFGDATGG
ncbi:DUF1684 domain-containing protein, partial [Streptomyces sp. NPDC054840]